MQYDDVLIQLGGFGRYQKRLLALYIIPSFLDPITSYWLTFILGQHKHRCQLPDQLDKNFNILPLNNTWNVSECLIYKNGSEFPCNNWLYDQSQYTSTLISSFNMVCDNKFLRSHMMVFQYFGMFFGSITYGLICDTFGRRHVLSIALLGMFLPNFVRSFVYNVYFVGVLIFANGYFSVMLYQTAFTLVTELVDKSKRVLSNFLIYFSFCMGEYVTLLFSYFIRDWRTLGLATSLPVGISLLSLFFTKESPRWLVAKGKFRRAEVIFRQMMKENGVQADINAESVNINDNETTSSFTSLLKLMLKSRLLLIRLVILCFNWFAINMTYFGITMKVGNLGGNAYINFFVSTTAEVLALFICLFVMDRLGRKRVFSISMFICAVCCLCTIFTSIFGGDSYHWITIGLAMIGKLFITVAYFSIYLIAAENFPTILRAFMIGICSTFGRVGAMASAYVGDLGILIETRFGIALPLIVFGGFGLTAAVFSLFLPETRFIVLPQTILEAENLQRKSNIQLDYKISEQTGNMIELEDRNTDA